MSYSPLEHEMTSVSHPDPAACCCGTMVHSFCLQSQRTPRSSKGISGQSPASSHGGGSSVVSSPSLSFPSQMSVAPGKIVGSLSSDIRGDGGVGNGRASCEDFAHTEAVFVVVNTYGTLPIIIDATVRVDVARKARCAVVRPLTVERIFLDEEVVIENARRGRKEETRAEEKGEEDA